MAGYDDKAALIVVDMQNDFVAPGGALYVKGGEGILTPINAEIDRAMAAGAHVFYTQDWHPPSTPHFEKDGGIWPVHCVAGSKGAELHSELRIQGEVVRKGTGGEDGYSGFSVRDPLSGEENATRLESLLRQQGIERVVVAGLATDYCVKETALDALRLGFATTVLADATRAVDRSTGDGDRALDEMERAGAQVE